MERSYSFIIPVYNRPQEIRELLESFAQLHFKEPFEIVIIEDGSAETADEVIELYKNSLSVSYYFKENSGPGASRNYGMQRANGNYFIILDSDCLLPPQYLAVVDGFLNETYFDCFGGADAAHHSFSPLQKAINYTMTSFFTTGGIRGNKNRLQPFEPRSFNMGISKEVFLTTGGFANIHPGEDPDLSQRILKAGFKTTFIPDAFVYHKRRISWEKFYAQVRKFGLARPILNQWHPQSAKITFWFPSIFVGFSLVSILAAIFVHPFLLIPLLGYVGIIFVDSGIKNKSIKIGFLSVAAMFVQFFGYGTGFLKSSYYIGFKKKDPQQRFPKLFFK